MGHTIFNMEEFWRILKQKGDSRLDSESNEGTELIVCKLADECVWQFQKQPLFIRRQIIFQTIASDVTALHVYQDHLQKNIRKEEELHERQRELLQHIVQNNLDQELLNAKLRIHDDFGSVLLMTRHWLKNTEHVPDNESDIFSAWENVITDMENALDPRNKQIATQESELIEVAELVGCHVELSGPRPAEYKQQLLLYAAIREALTNAVRHAGADRLWVEMVKQDNCFHVEIRSNGDKTTNQIEEGSGLGNLRRRLEREGILMKIDCQDGVVMILDMPIHTEKDA